MDTKQNYDKFTGGLKILRTFSLEIENQINNLASDGMIPDKSFFLLREANLKQIEVSRLLDEARGWAL